MKLAFLQKVQLETRWKRDLAPHWFQQDQPPLCLRCGYPMEPELQENALSRYVEADVCSRCGMDEALRDYAGTVLPISLWAAAVNGDIDDIPVEADAVLTNSCNFQHIFSGEKKEVIYSRSGFHGSQWWTSWMNRRTAQLSKELLAEIDAFQDGLMALPEFKNLHAMSKMCVNCAALTSKPNEFDLYSETDHFNVWLHMNTRPLNYHLYVHFYAK